MSKSRIGWLLAIALCIPLASCAMDMDGQALDDPDVTEEAAAAEEAEPAPEQADVGAQDCTFSQQCDPCEPPWVQQTAQRVWNECGVTGTLWTIKYYCALCD